MASSALARIIRTTDVISIVWQQVLSPALARKRAIAPLQRAIWSVMRVSMSVFSMPAF